MIIFTCYANLSTSQPLPMIPVYYYWAGSLDPFFSAPISLPWHWSESLSPLSLSSGWQTSRPILCSAQTLVSQHLWTSKRINGKNSLHKLETRDSWYKHCNTVSRLKQDSRAKKSAFDWHKTSHNIQKHYAYKDLWLWFPYACLLT